jgi:hypothetical protein
MDRFDPNLEALAASHDLDVDDFLALVHELTADQEVEYERLRLAAADVVAEAEELLRRVRTVWGSVPERQMVDVVLADDELSGRERLMLLGYLVLVHHQIPVHSELDRKTARKYRDAAERLGLDHQHRVRGRLPGAQA